MPGPTLGPQAVADIHASVAKIFDRLRARLDPKKYGPKRLWVGVQADIANPNRDRTLGGLYEASASAGGWRPSEAVEEALVRAARGYVDAYEAKARVRAVEAVQSALHDDAHGRVDAVQVLRGELSDVFGEVKRDVDRMISTETTAARNMGAVEGLVKANVLAGREDPVVFFAVVHDQHRCMDCTDLHLLEDGVTPRLWLMSELESGYHRRGSGRPSIRGSHPRCFAGSVRLHTDRGLLTVEELYRLGGANQVAVDLRVKNRRIGNNQFGAEIPGRPWLDRHESGAQMCAATEVYDTGVQECVRVTLEGGIRLDVSLNHEFWVDDDIVGLKVEAKDLRVGDKVPLLSGEGGWGTDHFPDLAELMGNLMGDGSLGKGEGQWKFFGDDLPYGERLKAIAFPYFGNQRKSDGMTIHPPDEKYQVSRAGFNSLRLGRIFAEDFSLSKKPRRVPARLWAADSVTVAAFLRGLYAADGHAEAKPAVCLAQNDVEFLREIQLLVANFGIRSRIFTHGEEGVTKPLRHADGSVRDVERKACWRLLISGYSQCRLFADRIGMGVPKKQGKLLGFLDASKKASKAWRTARVVSIDPIGAQQTYCLTEPRFNTVAANGVVVGQCRCTLTSLLPGYGFDAAGSVQYISKDHDEFAQQRGG